MFGEDNKVKEVNDVEEVDKSIPNDTEYLGRSGSDELDLNQHLDIVVVQRSKVKAVKGQFDRIENEDGHFILVYSRSFGFQSLSVRVVLVNVDSVTLVITDRA